MAGDSAGFESYLRGSWWEVKIEEERSFMFLVTFTADESERAWVPLSELRPSSRRADDWDCYIIKKGMDVAVLAKHPHTKSLDLEQEGFYDARVSSVSRSIHAPGKCSCKFSVRFFNVMLDTSTDGTYGILLDRILLTDEPEIEMSISEIRILQKPAEIIPLRHVLDAHLAGRWIPIGRGCQDSYFLQETKLGTTTRPMGAFVEDDTDPAQVRSAEVLSPSPARVSEKNGERASRDTPVDGPQLYVRGCRKSLGTDKWEYRVPKSAFGARQNHKQKDAPGCADETSPQTMNIKRTSFSAEDHDDDRSEGILGEKPPGKKRGRPKREYPQIKRKENTSSIVKNTVEIETTRLSSDTSDSETEWKPLTGLRKKLPVSNICTREGTIAHKPKLEEVSKPRRNATRSSSRGDKSGKRIS